MLRPLSWQHAPPPLRDPATERLAGPARDRARAGGVGGLLRRLLRPPVDHRPGWGIPAREADDLLRQAEMFLEIVQGILGVPITVPLPDGPLLTTPLRRGRHRSDDRQLRPPARRVGYSMRYGTAKPEQLVERAVAFGQPALALTDRDGLYGAVKFVTACMERGVDPILGVDLALGPDPIGSRVAIRERRAEELAAPHPRGRTRCEVVPSSTRVCPG